MIYMHNTVTTIHYIHIYERLMVLFCEIVLLFKHNFSLAYFTYKEKKDQCKKLINQILFIQHC
jgi:hypothetical protein